MEQFDWVNRDLFPFQSRFADLDGHRIHYLDEGSGDVILFSHGTPEWSFGWRDLVKLLRRDFRCIAPDLLGMGLSDKPADADFSVAAHAARLEKFIEALDLKNIHLVANDFGIGIALAYAIRHPGNVRKISIFNGWMWRLSTDPHYARPVKLFSGWLGNLAYRYFNFPVNVIMPAAFGNRRKFLPAEVHRHYRMALPNANARRATFKFAQELFGAGDFWEALWNRRDALKGKPLLIFWGMKDSFVPPYELEKWATAFPDAEVVRCAEAGHFVQEEEAEVMATALKRHFQS